MTNIIVEYLPKEKMIVEIVDFCILKVSTSKKSGEDSYGR